MMHQSPTDGGPPGAEQGFRQSADVFVTFLYGAAVHLVIHNAHTVSGTASLAASLIPLMLIAFLFSDWASRTRLPRLIPEQPPGYVYVCKALLEISCVYFLIDAFILMMITSGSHSTINHGRSRIYLSFAGFFLMTYLWNLLMIRVMRRLDFTPLLWAVLKGDAIDMEDTKEEYLANFLRWKRRRERYLSLRMHLALASVDRRSRNNPVRVMFAGASGVLWKLPTSMFDGAVSSITQFLANHVLYANLIAALVLGTNVVITENWSTREGLLLNFGYAERFQLHPAYSLTVIVGAALYFAVALDGLPRRSRRKLPRRGRGFFNPTFLTSILVVGIGMVVLAYSDRPAPNVEHGDAWMSLAASGCLVFLTSSLVYAFRSFIGWQPLTICGGIAVGLPIMVLYFVLPPPMLIGMVAIQQVIANVFLQLTVTPRTVGTSTTVDCVPAEA